MPRKTATATAAEAPAEVEAPAAAESADEAPAEAPAPKTRPVKRYTITKRVVTIFTYVVDAYTEPEALRIAADTGEVHADETTTASESWKVHRELNKVVGEDIIA